VNIDTPDLGERAVRGTHGAHGLGDEPPELTHDQHVLASCYTTPTADLQLLGDTAGQRTLKLVQAVERATVRAQHASDARVRLGGDLLHFLERRRADCVQCFPGAPPQTRPRRPRPRGRLRRSDESLR